MSIRPAVATFVGIFVYAQFAQAQMSSTSYLIRWDTINTGGSDTANSVSYILRDSVESSVSGRTTGTSYNVDQGYRGGVFDQVISFTVTAQDLNDARAASSLVGTAVTVSSVSGISAGSYVAVIQDLGASQVAAIGRVTSVAGSTITVDSWTNGGAAPTVDGTSDFVYPLSGATAAFGNLSSSSVKTAIIGFNVSVDNTNGYTVQMNDDGNLRSVTADIDDVLDGTVSEGVEEYGVRSSDTSLASSTFDTADTAVTTTYQDVVTVGSVSMDSRGFVTLKAAISSGSSTGSYAQVISFIASGNF